MLKNKIILAVIAVIIALGLAGCRAEKDNVSSVAVNTESSITETVSEISETPADASSNKAAEITEKPESSAPTNVVSNCSRFSISSMNPLAFLVLPVLPVHLPQPEAQNGHAHAK